MKFTVGFLNCSFEKNIWSTFFVFNTIFPQSIFSKSYPPTCTIKHHKRVKLNAGQKASLVKVLALAGQTVEIESGSLRYITVL